MTKRIAIEELSTLNKRSREGAFIVIAALAVFCLLALITYHHNDPSWSHITAYHQIQNAGGKAGAWFADLFLYAFGYVAYLFPVAFIFGAWSILPKVEKPQIDYPLLLLRFLGFVLLVSASSALFSLHVHRITTYLPFHAGGILGDVIGHGLANYFNNTGTTLLLVAFILSGVTLSSGWSWLKTFEAIGRYCIQMPAYIKFIYRCVIIGFRKFIFSPGASIASGINTLRMKRKNLKKLEYKPLSQKMGRQITTSHVQPPPSPTQTTAQTQPHSQSSPSIGKLSKPTTLPRISKARSGELPSLELLDLSQEIHHPDLTHEALEMRSRDVEARLLDFGIQVRVTAVHPGPVITRFELELAAGLKVSKVVSIAKDIARSLSVMSVRVVEVIPGKAVIGLELPNQTREIVRLRETLSSRQYQQAASPLSLALGKDIAGHPVVVDLAKMPHLLVAGTTGSGKSVSLNAMLLSLLYKATPDEVRLIMVDPKMLELAIYDGIPHLLTPVVTDMKEAANALRWCVAEMDRRYRLMAALGVRNLAGFNAKVKAAIEKKSPIPDPTAPPIPDETPPTLEPLPYIVVLVDEFADMMMVVGKKVEELIARIAQKARAAGIHLILATQRPSVDVITGLIKANVPTRIAFQVSSRVDSRTIIDQQGAEQLLGHGDMLYLAPGTGVPVRVHGAFVADEEVHKVVNDLKQRGEPAYMNEILEGPPDVSETGEMIQEGDDDPENDPLYDQAVQIVIETQRASISSVQRRLRIGYNRAAKLLDAMEAAGVVSPMENSGLREVLVPAQPQ